MTNTKWVQAQYLGEVHRGGEAMHATLGPSGKTYFVSKALASQDGNAASFIMGEVLGQMPEAEQAEFKRQARHQ